MKNKMLPLIMFLLGLLAFTSCEETKDIPVFNLPIYENLYMVGDATPAGWDINNPTPMTVDANDPFTFTYTGPLTAGQFKIPTTKGNWGCDYFMPVNDGESDLSVTTVSLVKNGNPDRKWKITEAGNYTITINILNPAAYSIHIVKL